MLVDSCEAWDVMMDAWAIVMDYAEELFDGFVSRFVALCAPWPLFFEYVNITRIIPHMEKFVKL